MYTELIVTKDNKPLRLGSPGTPVRKALLWLLPLAFLAVYGPTIWWLIGRWSMGVWYQSHGFAIPLVSAFIIWRRLTKEKRPVQPEASPLGFLFLVPALALHLTDTILWSQILSAFSMVLAVMGVFLLLLGRVQTERLWFPLLLLFLMIPIPAAAVEPLHRGSSQVERDRHGTRASRRQRLC